MKKLKLRHPVFQHFQGDKTPLGIRLANSVTGFMGSWTFLILQTLVVAGWIAGNVYLIFHFDPYPFILLNLAFSTQAAYAAPLILMASNVAAARDRELWDHDYETNQKAYAKIEELETQIKLIAQQNNDLLKLFTKETLGKNESD